MVEIIVDPVEAAKEAKTTIRKCYELTLGITRRKSGKGFRM